MVNAQESNLHPVYLAANSSAYRNMKRQLTVGDWITGFRREKQFAEFPMLAKFLDEESSLILTSEAVYQNEREKWIRLSAIYCIADSRFFSCELPLPRSVNNDGLQQDTYCLTDVPGPDQFSMDLWTWSEEYLRFNPEKEYYGTDDWSLMHKIVKKYMKLWRDRFQQILQETPKDAVAAIELQRDRRDFFEESTWYSDTPLRNEVIASVKDVLAENRNLDHGARFLLAALEKWFINGDRRLRKLRKILLDGYWDRLKDLAKNSEAKTIVELLREEVPAMYDRG